MEFRFTYNDTFEQTFRLDSDTILKINSSDTNDTCIVSFVNTSGETIHIPDGIVIDGAEKFDDNFILQSNVPLYNLLFNDQVVYEITNEKIVRGRLRPILNH